MRVSLVFLVSIFYFWANISIALEETSYRVIAVNEIYEIREYDDRLAVQTIQKTGKTMLLENYLSIFLGQISLLQK